MNRLVLQAQILERAAIRYTPAGLPALVRILQQEILVVDHVFLRSAPDRPWHQGRAGWRSSRADALVRVGIDQAD